MQFESWEVNNNIVTPNPNSDTMSINLQAGDTVIAHFASLLPSYALSVNVYPAGAGDVTIQNYTPANYPANVTYLSGQTISMSATPSSGFTFDYWTLANHFVNPNSTDPNVYFTLATGDDIVAHFKSLTGIDEVNVGSLSVFPTLTADQFHLSYEMLKQTD
jgi:hypothetical protein